jgi:hypothetical protein
LPISVIIPKNHIVIAQGHSSTVPDDFISRGIGVPPEFKFAGRVLHSVVSAVDFMSVSMEVIQKSFPFRVASVKQLLPVASKFRHLSTIRFAKANAASFETLLPELFAETFVPRHP